MTKDVLVSIRGMQFAGDVKNEPIEVITTGTYYKRNGKHFVLYDEVMEGVAEPTKNIVKIGEHCLDITKRGAVNVHMMFEQDKKNVTYYDTPYGSLLIGIAATKIVVEESENDLCIVVDYGLEVNYEHMADCAIEMKIKNKKAGDFRI